MTLLCYVHFIWHDMTTGNPAEYLELGEVLMDSSADCLSYTLLVLDSSRLMSICHSTLSDNPRLCEKACSEFCCFRESKQESTKQLPQYNNP